MVDQGASEWLKKQQRASRRTRIVVSTIGILVVTGVLAGVIFALVHKGTSNSQTTGSNPSSNNSTGPNNGRNGGDAGGGKYIPNNPKGPYYTSDDKQVDLVITKDPNLSKSFYGINYGPKLAIFPWCTNTLGDTIEDVKMLSQLTNRIRLYGMDCNALNYTLYAIKLLGVSMTVVPTVWVDKNITTYQRQYQDLANNLKEHGLDLVEGISVGNEVIFRQDVPTTELFSRIAEVRTKFKTMFPNFNIPVFTSDIGSNVDASFVQANDVIFANVHPYFGGVAVNTASNWTFEFFQSFDLDKAVAGGKQAVMSEIGWPTNGTSNQQAVASVDNLQTFLTGFVCTANIRKVKYYYFEMFDTPWKTDYFGPLEGSWGLFNPDRSFKKNIKLPTNCDVTVGGLLADSPSSVVGT